MEHREASKYIVIVLYMVDPVTVEHCSPMAFKWSRRRPHFYYPDIIFKVKEGKDIIIKVYIWYSIQ